MAKQKKQAADKPEGRKEPARVVREQAWQTVIVPTIVRREAREFLTIGQYVHVTDFVKQLTGFGSRRYDRTICIAPIDEFWELKEKGGMLGKINVRIYFAFLKESNEIAILHAYKKEDDAQVHPSVLLLVRQRCRRFVSGELRDGAVTYKGPHEASW